MAAEVRGSGGVQNNTAVVPVPAGGAQIAPSPGPPNAARNMLMLAADAVASDVTAAHEILAEITFMGGNTVQVKRKKTDLYDIKGLIGGKPRKRKGPQRPCYEVSSYGKPWRTVTADSMGVLNIQDKKRLALFAVVESTAFDNVILFIIMLNSLVMAMHVYRYDTTDPETGEQLAEGFTWQNQMDAFLDPIFLTLFGLESFLKICAYGFFADENTYLRDGWNWLDFLVVVTGITEKVGSGTVDVSFLRAFRVLRPLRSLNSVKEMKVIVNTVLLSIPRLGNVALMAVFLMTIFGILAISFWSGVMFRRCRITQDPVLMCDIVNMVPCKNATMMGSAWMENADESELLEAYPDSCWSFPPDPETAEGRLCGGAYQCEKELHQPRIEYCKSNWDIDAEDMFKPVFKPDVLKPKTGTNPPDGPHNIVPWCEDSANVDKDESFNFGLTTFDNLLKAILVIFQCITMEGWVDIMYMLQDSHSDVFASLYFVLLIIVGSFFVLNIALAIVGDAYDQLSIERAAEAKKEEEDKLEAEQKAHDDSLAANPTPAPAAGGVVPGVAATGAGALVAPGGVQVNRFPEETALPFPPRASIAPVWKDHPVVHKFRSVAEGDIFQNMIMFFIVANVAVMMTDQYPEHKVVLRSSAHVFNLVFTSIFAVEFLVLHIAVGPRTYWTTLSTFFDGVIVVSSLVELTQESGGAVKALRGFRLLRVFKLAKKWTSFKILLKSMIHTILSMVHFTVLLFLMMFVFTLMGMSFFANKMRFYDDGTKMESPEPNHIYCNVPNEADGEYTEGNIDCIPRAHFDDFLTGFVTCFQILSGENWNTVMYDAMKGSSEAASLVFILFVVVGQLIVLNLFLAILMANFEESSSSIRAEEDAKKAIEKARKQAERQERVAERERKRASTNTAAEGTQNSPALRSQQTEGEDKDQDDENPDADCSDSCGPLGSKGRAMCIFSDANPIRRFAVSIVGRQGAKDEGSGWFDNLILACICISSVAMAVDDPLANPHDPLPQFLAGANIFFTSLFCTEMLLKMVANGIWCGKNSYFRVSWNFLDFVVVCVSVIDMLPVGGEISFFKTLRVLRALRPLRVISRNENLKLVVNTLFKSVPELCNLLVVGALFFLIFGLLGVSFFKGSFFTCQIAVGGEFAEMAVVRDSFAANGTSAMCIDMNKTSATYGLVWPMMTSTCDRATWIPYTGEEGEFEQTVRAPSAYAELAEWRRSSPDVPICEASCNPDPSNDSSQRPAVCPGPLVCDSADNCDIPNMCSGFGQPELILNNPDHPWVVITQRDVMPCGDVEVTTAAGEILEVQGCKNKFCPETEDDGATCLSRCNPANADELFFCAESCQDDALSEECDACLLQCRAACNCEEPYMHCAAVMKDAATCVEQGGQWVNMNQNFDSVTVAMLSLVEISTTEGWVDVMYSAMDTTGPMLEPERDNKKLFSLFFVLFIFVGSFFFLNLCVGVIVDNFGQIKEETGGSVMETEAQQKWREGKKSLRTRKALFGVTNLQALPRQRRILYLVTNHPYFENFIMVCIILNTVVMGIKQFPPPENPDPGSLQIINYIFASVFTVEAGLKLYVLRETYFRDGWNNFDMVCVVATMTGIIVDRFSTVKLGSVMSGIRLFRIARLFRLLRFAKGLNQLFTAFILSIPKLLNVAIILLLLLFLYSVMGVHMFSKTHMHTFHNEHANFRSFPRAFLTLLRCMTGEAWNEIMHSMKKDASFFALQIGQPCMSMPTDKDLFAELYPMMQEKCLIDMPIECGSAPMAVFYFVSYTCTITFVILNLFVAVVLEGFQVAEAGEEEVILQKCIEIWQRYDKNIDMWLPVKDVQAFMDDVEAEYCQGRRWSPPRTNEERDDKKKLVKEAREFVFKWLHCSNSQVSFMNATLGSLMLLLSLVAVNDPPRNGGDGGLAEVKQAIKEIRDLTLHDRGEDEDNPPSNRDSQMLGFGPQALTDNGGLVETFDASNFQNQAAALTVQRKFREKLELRASSRNSRVAPKSPQEGDIPSSPLPSARKISTEPGSAENMKQVSAENAERPDNSDLQLPGALHDPEEARKILPVAAG